MYTALAKSWLKTFITLQWEELKKNPPQRYKKKRNKDLNALFLTEDRLMGHYGAVKGKKELVWTFKELLLLSPRIKLWK